MAFDHDKARQSFNTPELQQIYKSLLLKVEMEMSKSYRLNSYARTIGENIKILNEKFENADVGTLVFMLSEAILESLNDSLVEKFTQEDGMKNKSKDDLFDVAIFNIVHGVGYVIDENRHDELLGNIDSMYNEI